MSPAKSYFAHFFFLSFVCFFFISLTVEGQTAKIDSIKSKIATASAKQKLDLIFGLLKERSSMSGDSILKYISLADSINKRSPDRRSDLLIDYYKAGSLQQQGFNDSAFAICEQSLALINSDTSLHDIELKFKNNKAAFLIRNNKFKEAIATFLDALNEAEKFNDPVNQIIATNGIGWANMELENYPEAITWLNKATRIEISDVEYKIYPLSNLAAIYNNIKKHDSAFVYIEKAIQYAGEAEDLKALANGYAIKSGILVDLNKPAGAEQMLMDAIEIRKKIGDDYYIISDMYQLGAFYANSHQCEKGKAICNEGIALAKKKNLQSKFIILYQALAENYKSCNDYKGYASVLEELISLKDSMQIKNSAKAIAEMQTKYEVAKKENIIVQQEYTLTKRNYLYFGSVILFALIGIIALLIFYQYKQKQKSRQLLAVSGAKEDERMRIAAELHDEIGSSLSSISLSNELAQRFIDKDHDKTKRALKSIGVTSAQSLESIGDIVWALSPKNDSGKNMLQKMKRVTLDLLESKNIKVHFETKTDFENLKLNMNGRKNIFLIFKEAVHNISKYAECSEVNILFEKNNQLFSMTINDNGKGFEVPKSSSGNGLGNMQRRANDLNGNITIDSVLNKGTTIRLEIDISNIRD